MIKKKNLENLFIMMAIAIQANGNVIKEMEKEFYIIRIKKYTKEILKIMNLMEKEKSYTIMEIIILEILLKVKWKEMENIIIKMEKNIQVN